jgi:hypothetical protein
MLAASVDLASWVACNVRSYLPCRYGYCDWPDLLITFPIGKRAVNGVNRVKGPDFSTWIGLLHVLHGASWYAFKKTAE